MSTNKQLAIVLVNMDRIILRKINVLASELMPGLSQLEIWEKNDTNEVTFVENMLSLFLVFSQLKLTVGTG